MTRFIEWTISLLIVIALFVVIGLFLPAKRSVSHSVETNRSMATVNDLLSSFTRFKDWNALINHDPRMRLTVTGPESGVGARLEYASTDPVVGAGAWELVEAIPGERLVYSLRNDASGRNKRMTFTLERTGQRNQNVKITQRYTVDYGWNLLGRYAGLYVTDSVGDDIKRGLNKLSNLLTTIPRFDYSLHPAEFAFVDVPAANVLVAPATAPRANDAIAVAMTNQRKWMDQVMEKSGLEPAGPMRIVTTDFGADNYAFDVVLPVRPKGTGPAEEGEGDAEAAPAPAAAPAAPPERLEVVIDGENNPVIYAQQPAIRAAITTYVGPAPGLPRVRDLLRAWAIVRGAEPASRPFEDYRIEIKDMLADDAEFTVYWPVRVGGEAPAEMVQITPPPPAEGSAPPAGGESADGDAPAEEGAEAATADAT